jgi:hypothetical protein
MNVARLAGVGDSVIERVCINDIKLIIAKFFFFFLFYEGKHDI